MRKDFYTFAKVSTVPREIQLSFVEALAEASSNMPGQSKGTQLYR
jgi:hypothetical protein